MRKEPRHCTTAKGVLPAATVILARQETRAFVCWLWGGGSSGVSLAADYRYEVETDPNVSGRDGTQA
jgi:hypothetical protein